MSNNSCVTRDGLEIGRAQAAQAEAARLEPEAFMNPILLKPRKDTSSEIVLMGKVFDAPADYYRSFTMNEGLAAVRGALTHIEKNFDAVVIEGAGSPAEVNLNDTEIVNMRVAREADVPVILTADVDRGGALAAVVGTLELLGDDRERVKAIIFNKFRGDLLLFEPAVRWTERRTGIRVAGVMPWLPGIRVAGEDSLSIPWGSLPQSFPRNGRDKTLFIGAVRLSYVSNYTDFEAFAAESDVEVVQVDERTPLHRLDAVVLPGTKSTVQDMKALRDSGLADRIVEFHERGGAVFGLCGGYQMMGERLDDPFLRDNDQLREMEGLGLLPVVTDFTAEEKTTIQSAGRAVHPSFPEPFTVQGYEIHFGETRRLREKTHEKDETLSEKFHALFILNGREDGLADTDFHAAGTYLHNAFHNSAFRAFWLNLLRRRKDLPERLPSNVEEGKNYDALAARMTQSLDMEYILALAGLAPHKGGRAR
jgi:adenosylcobyric acid synthase